MSIMSINRIKYLQECLESGAVDLDELSEIETAFALIPDSELRDLRENALAVDMLDELEERATPLEKAIYHYVSVMFGENEAMDPSWDIGALANALEQQFSFKVKE